MLAGFLIVTILSVVGGWVLAFVVGSAKGAFSDIDAFGIDANFGRLISDGHALIMWHTVFMLMTILVVALGVKRGLQGATALLVPTSLIIIVILLAYSVGQADVAIAVDFLFRPDFSRLTMDTVLVAIGQAFFTTSVGAGAVMAYGAYAPSRASIFSTSLAALSVDTIIGLAVGVFMFAVVFATGLEFGQGPGLVFQTLPLAFGYMPGGVIFGTMFFLLLFFAAWTSSIGLIEPAVAWVTERWDVTRPKAAWIVGGAAWILGIGAALSFNLLANFTLLRGTIFENLDYLASNILLPTGGLLIAIFAGWIVDARVSREQLRAEGVIYWSWRILTRFVAPVGIVTLIARSM